MAKPKKPPAPTWDSVEIILASTGLDAPPDATLDEVGAILTKAPVQDGWRFGFSDLDDSVCDDEDFLALVAWLFPLLPDDAQKAEDMSIAYGDGLAFGFEKAAAWLIEHGLDLKKVMWNEGTALGFAASYNRPATVKLLIEKGCDPNAYKRKGTPPLFELIYNLRDPDPDYAWIYEDAIETARLLIDAGAKREMTSGKKKIRDVDIAQGSLKKWLMWLDSGKEGKEIGVVVKPGTPKKPKTTGKPKWTDRGVV